MPTSAAGSLSRWRLIGYENDELDPETVANVARSSHRSDQHISDRPLVSGPTAADRRVRLYGAWLRQAGPGPGCVPGNSAGTWRARTASDGMAHDPGRDIWRPGRASRRAGTAGQHTDGGGSDGCHDYLARARLPPLFQGG